MKEMNTLTGEKPLKLRDRMLKSVEEKLTEESLWKLEDSEDRLNADIKETSREAKLLLREINHLPTEK